MNNVRKSAGLLLTLALAACSSGPGATARAFDTAASAGHTAEAVEHLDPSLRQIGGPKLIGGLTKASQGVAAKGGLKSVSVSDEKVDGDYATVKVNETFGNGTTASSPMKLRRVDGKWYVTF